MNEFEKTIKSYLDERAKTDTLFAAKYKTGVASGKNVLSCCNYIIEQVKKSHRQGFADDEIFGMAVHYYDEESIKAVRNGSKAVVVVNREIQLSPEEEQKVREEARLEVIAAIKREEQAKVRKELESKEPVEKKPKATKKKPVAAEKRPMAKAEKRRPKVADKRNNPIEQLSLFDF